MQENAKVLLARVDELKQEIDSLRPLTPQLEAKIFAKFRLDWNYHSNAIEGNKLSLGETATFLLEGLTANGKPMKDHLDLRGHNEVIDYLTLFVRRSEVLTEAVIREMHKVLLVEPYKAESVTPDGKKTERWVRLGEYKTVPNQVTTATGEVHRYVLPEETPLRMQRLVASVRKASTEHPVIIASLFHHEFVAIHPFDDGNGRMARILMNLILMQNGFPPVVIRLEERERYFAALRHADGGENLPLITLMAERLIAAMQLYLRGASGEELQEPDDIDKRIALLKQELNNVPEPTPFSEAVYQTLLKETIRPILEKVGAKLSKFNELFIADSMSIMIHTKTGTRVGNSSIGPTVSTDIMNALASQAVNSINVHYRWNDFKKGDIKTFDSNVEMRINLGKLTFQIAVGQTQLTKLYAANLNDEEVIMITTALAEAVLKQIEQKLGKANKRSGLFSVG